MSSDCISVRQYQTTNLLVVLDTIVLFDNCVHPERNRRKNMKHNIEVAIIIYFSVEITHNLVEYLHPHLSLCNCPERIHLNSETSITVNFL